MMPHPHVQARAHACAGSIVLYAALVIVLLGSLTFLLQGMILPLMTTGYTSEQVYQIDALEASFKNIFRQQLDKKAKGSALWHQLQTMQGKTLTITDADNKTIGTVTPSFTPYWFRTGATASSSLTLPADMTMPPLAAKNEMVAVTESGIQRFIYNWAQKKIEQAKTGTASIPANADIYFALHSKNANDALKFNNRTLTYTLENTNHTAIKQFARILPQADGLVGALGGNASTSHQDQLTAAFVYGKTPQSDINTLTLAESARVLGDETTLKGYDLLLGQHVLADLTITLPSGAIAHRQWHFNGRTSFQTNSDYNKDIIAPNENENETLQDFVVARNPQSNDNNKWAVLGSLPASGKGWSAISVLKPSANQPKHAQFMKNIEGNENKNETTLQWARLVIKQPMLKNYDTTPVNTSYKLSFAPYGQMQPPIAEQNYFYGLILRQKFYGSNPHDGAKGLVVGLLYGDMDLNDMTDSKRLVDNTYPLDPAVLFGFDWTAQTNGNGNGNGNGNTEYFYSIKDNNITTYYGENTAYHVGIYNSSTVKRSSGAIDFSPRVLVWAFDDGDVKKTAGKMTLLAVGQPEGDSFPKLSENNADYTALHVNLEENTTVGSQQVNDLRIVLALPDFTKSCWISMEANASDADGSANNALLERQHITWRWVNNSAGTTTIANPRQVAPSNPMSADEPQEILRIQGFTGAEYNYAGIFSSLVGAAQYQQTYLRDFGMAVTNKAPAKQP